MASTAKMIDSTVVTAGEEGEVVLPSREEAIRNRAYEIYVERGGRPGHELDDWLQAEQELTK